MTARIHSLDMSVSYRVSQVVLATSSKEVKNETTYQVHVEIKPIFGALRLEVIDVDETNYYIAQEHLDAHASSSPALV